MGTSKPEDLPITSPDLERLGIVTATPVGPNDEAGRGSIYTPGGLAAGRLFHIHNADDAFLCSYSTYWTAATANTAIPGDFTAKTVVDRPSFWWVDPKSNGSIIGALSSPGATPGRLYPQGDNTLRISSAVSVRDMVVYLGRHAGGNFIATYRVGKGVTQFISSRWLTPIINKAGVTTAWDRGIYGFSGVLYVVGSRPDNTLTLMKTPMGQDYPVYLAAGGWSSQMDLAQPLKDTNGNPIVSLGNVSLGHYRNQWIMSVVVDGGTQWTAKFYRAQHPTMGWQPLAAPTLNLSPKTTSAMLCGVFFQPAATPNPEYASLVSDDHLSGGVAYTYTTETSASLRTSWGVLAIPGARL